MIKLFFASLILAWVGLTTVAQDISIVVTDHKPSTCSGTFVAHELDHTTFTKSDPIRMFDSNGSGLAINDLDNDGLLDIVLANLDGEETILWNDGNLAFRTQRLDIPIRTRQVMILDLDADGLRDILFTSQRGAPTWWRNQGDESFELTAMPGVSHIAYAMNWADLDGDGDLDMVAASYDAEMQRIDAGYLLRGGSGVYHYNNHDGSFEAKKLANQSQALAVHLQDFDFDNNLDIAIGNDFAEVDAFWFQSDKGWQSAMPFDVVTHSTMGFASADIDNNQSIELYATDMQPYNDDDNTMEAWQPILDGLLALPMTDDDPQIMTNVLQMPKGDGFQNVSEQLEIESTGWSWSGKFGDLNSDGYVDLYVVNGMIAEDLFWHLPSNELVEENQAFMNQRGRVFLPVPDWNLNSTASGRGMSMADLDADGDLDIVVNNLMSPAVLFENQLCEGNNLTLSLRDTRNQNTDAIGARVILNTTAGTYLRELSASSGYLSGDPAQIHFGIPFDAELLQLTIIWVNGQGTIIDDLEANTHLVIQQTIS